MKKIKSDAKLIAFKCIQQFATCKYVPNQYVIEFVKQYTDDPKVIKEAVNQVFRAVKKLQPIVIYPRIR